MKIHEYQSKAILQEYGVEIPKGRLLQKKEDLDSILQEFSFPCVFKVQIHAGGRGKAGGVKLVKNREEAEEFVEKFLGKRIRTYQTTEEGQPVSAILVEEALPIEKEYYLAITLDRSREKPLLMLSSEGGVEIEEVAKKSPEKILKEYIEPSLGLQDWQARKLAYHLGLKEKEEIKQFFSLVKKLWKVYWEKDASLVEINPLIKTQEGRILPLDAKINIDDNALFRHPELKDLEDPSQEDPLEVEAKKHNLNYVRLDGEIGCMVNGAGLAMATMDMIKHAGSFPANFLDVGGGANVETVTNGFALLLKDPNVKAIFVNIFGGIVRCDRIAKGILEAAKRVEIHVPLVVRLAGTNAEEARRMLEESSLSMYTATTLKEGAEKAVELARKGGA